MSHPYGTALRAFRALKRLSGLRWNEELKDRRLKWEALPRCAELPGQIVRHLKLLVILIILAGRP
jgi:hypothetical protein